MASKVLKSFLIGIGYDTKALEIGDRKINASLNGIKSGALGTSAALVGAFGTAAASVVGVASNVDKLAMSTQNLRTSQAAVYNYGNAIKLMGGDAADAVETLQRFEDIQNNLRLKGEAGPINDLAMAGLDVSTLYDTRTGEEFMRALAEMIPRLDEGQRSVVQDSLGLSDAVFRSLADGVEKLDASMKKASDLTGSVDQLTDNARKLAENSSEFGLIIEGIKNELADKFLPSLVGAGDAVNNFLKEYRPEISKAIDYSAENPRATAVLGTSAVAALTGAAAARLGLNTIGGVVSKTGTAGVAVTGSAIGANVLNRTLDEYVPGYSAASREFDELLKSMTGLERIKGPMELMFGGGSGRAESNPPVTETNDVAEPGASPSQAPQPDLSGGDYKEVPSSQIDDLVMAMRDAKSSVRSGEKYQDQRALDNSLSGAIDRRSPDLIYGERSASDIMPPVTESNAEDDRQANADAIAGALGKTPIKVENQQTFMFQLDGQALDTKITQVNERQNYEALGDLRTTTER
ncbi:hypothetical protein [Pseudomonas chlororaphis]|uniref:hypothetical protein n=1 Tax=Pseudomonas chlororaphis TaxID=587753 RepID=UPI0024081CA8|nr:hypothetical protein [Pseudomonas chlororaphis]